MGSCSKCGRFFVPESELVEYLGKCRPCWKYDYNNVLLVECKYQRVGEVPTPPNRVEWYDHLNAPEGK